jgi:hypothetical protein
MPAAKSWTFVGMTGGRRIACVECGLQFPTFQGAPTMKITKVEPLLLDRFLYVRVSTDAGITGLGESGTWGQLEASAASIAKYGEYLVGKDPFPIEHHWNVMLRANHFTGGAITGAVSALDIALWDIKGRRLACRFTNCSAAACGTRRGSTAT